MFRSRPYTPRRGNNGRGRARGKGGSPTKTPLKGVFADGVWHCNCNPRLPAQRFQVKKESKNKGRWFYTCQKTEAKRCDFFLWEDDAKIREEGAVLSNSRSEPRTNIDLTNSKPAQTPAQVADAGFIRRDKRSWCEFEDDDEFGDSFDAETLEIMNHVAETPSKSRKMDAFATPKRRVLPWLKAQEGTVIAGGGAGLLTPVTGKTEKEETFHTPATEPRETTATTHTRDSILYPQIRQRAPSPSPNMLHALESTPTPVRFANAEVASPDTPDLSSDVLKYLSEQKVLLPAKTLEGLKQLLGKHAFRTQGIIKGREISRLALKAKDAKTAELQHRITALEADFEAERAQNRYRDWETKASSQND